MNRKLTNPATISCVSCLVLALAACMSGCDENQTAAPPTKPVVPAERLAGLIEDTARLVEPGDFESTGTVTDVHTAAITIKNEKHPDGVVLAASGDLRVYDGSNEIELSLVKPGDRVKTYRERRGNRADGWQTLVVRIDVFPATPINEGSDSDSDTLTDEPSYPIKFKAVYVEADAATITIRSVRESEAKPSAMAIDRLVVVQKGGRTGGTELLAEGDLLELTSERRGNRADGWMSVVTGVKVIDEEQN